MRAGEKCCLRQRKSQTRPCCQSGETSPDGKKSKRKRPLKRYAVTHFNLKLTNLTTKMATSVDNSLLCTEVLDISELNQTPMEYKPRIPYPDLPPTVKAHEDRGQLRDDRVLQV